MTNTTMIDDPETGVDPSSFTYYLNDVAERYGRQKLPQHADGRMEELKAEDCLELERSLQALDTARVKDILDKNNTRKHIFNNLPRFRTLLQEKWGTQITIYMHLGFGDRLNLETVFIPMEGQDPFAADEDVEAAMIASGLHSHMEIWDMSTGQKDGKPSDRTQGFRETVFASLMEESAA